MGPTERRDRQAAANDTPDSLRRDLPRIVALARSVDEWLEARVKDVAGRRRHGVR